MARDRKPAWSLDPSEVFESSTGGSIGSRGRAGLTREGSLTRATISLRHGATGVEVAGEVPEGRYTRGRMRELREELRRRLFVELEGLVARRLRIPGR